MQAPRSEEAEELRAKKKGEKPKRTKRNQKEADKDEQVKAAIATHAAHVDISNSSIQTTGNTIDTICGPISEWACVPENLPHHPTLAFFGKRRTGKSTTITNILYHCCQDIPFGLVMSDTAYAG